MNIFSCVVVQYEKEEEAFETRAALHGVKWPPSNPKALHVDYSTNELLVEYKARDAGDIKPLLMEKPVVRTSHCPTFVYCSGYHWTWLINQIKLVG